jgi:hypothetical protein
MRLRLILALHISCLATPLLAASPYKLVATTALPAMPDGDFDQLVADERHDRLYVSAEDGAAMDVFDVKTGALIQSGGAVGSPHKVVFDAARQHLLVADGTDGSVKVLDTHLATIARIPVGAKPDTGVLDPTSRIFYVSSRNEAGDGSRISAISLDSLTVGKIYAIAATTLKGMILDRPNDRLLVSMRDKNAIGIVHLDTGAVESWTPTGLTMNVPLALDAKANLLFVGSRKPGKLSVLDARDGHVLQELPSTETSDSMSFDPAHERLYVSGDTGMSSYGVDPAGHVRLIATDKALDGKTSLFVPALHRLYVMRRKSATQTAALTIFAICPKACTQEAPAR